ncbi:DUF349 domain-containing protein [Salinicola avicenniae]|uniref:DUF349 domain-containing protein n=1 Tax=Salinicola avicenniae TaxID=2916836 RepID=UPI0020745EAC|nr:MULTISPECIES: DUF349 domain-containing protein [unclassified Salinicola]
MPGLFQRLFSSLWRSARWEHRDPAIRARAASQLGPDALDTLARLARDDVPAVRAAAVARVDDPSPLLAWHAAHPSDEIFQRLLDLLGGRVSEGPDLTSRIALIETLDDSALLDALVAHGDNQSLRLAALARIEDEARLIHHASENGITAVRRAAAERVTSNDGLTQLARQARRDKQVARLARERLAERRADAEQRAERAAEREKLLSAIEAHAHRPWEPMYEARLKHWLQTWESLVDGADDGQRERFDAAASDCRRRIAEHQRAHRELEQVKHAKAEARATRESILDTLEQALAVVTQVSPLTPDAMQQLSAKWRLQTERWQEISDHYGVSDDLRARHEALDQQVQTIWLAWERLQQESAPLRAAIDEGRDVAPVLERLAWPAALPPTELVQEAQQQRLATPDDEAAGGAREPRSVSPDAFAEQLATLAEALDQGHYRAATQRHRELRQQREATGPLPAELEQTYKQQTARLAELRDWRGFAAAPKREKLLHSLEALVEAREQRDAERHRQHQRLIREWRQLGDAAATREFAQRFRAASDNLHAQLADWEAERDAREQDNLAARQALCEHLQSLLDNPSDNADPDGLRRIRDTAQEQWDRHWPIPRRQAQALGRRYARLRHRLQTLIDDRAGDIATHKRTLVEQARQLAEDSASAAQRAEQAKALQQQWRALGRAPKGVEQTLWRQFRNHCDTIFAARDSVRGEQQAKQLQHFEAMQALIDRLDAWQPASANERHVLDAALAEAQRLAPLPRSRRSDGMEKRWQGIVHAREVTLDRLALAERAQRWPSYRAALEAAIGGDLPEAVPSDMRAALKARHAQATTPQDAEERLQRCLVQLDLLAGEPIPEALEPLRLEVQVARLNDGLGRPPSPPEELEQTLARLLSIAPLSAETWARYVDAFEHVLGRLAHSHHHQTSNESLDRA